MRFGTLAAVVGALLLTCAGSIATANERSGERLAAVGQSATSVSSKAANTRPADAEARDLAAFGAFYAANGETAQWVTSRGLNARGVAIRDAIRRAGDWGLDPEDFELPELGPAETSTRDLPVEVLTNAERQLTIAVLTYARHARGGRILAPSEQLSSYIDRAPQLLDPLSVLQAISTATDPAAYLISLHPRDPGFEVLRRRYVEVRAGGVVEALERLPAGPLLKPGTRHEQVAVLRRRLGLTAGGDADPALYDPALVEAVKAFQDARGQAADGIVGQATRAALNDVEEVTAERLLANMEMYRWLPPDLGELHVRVNVPEFMIRVVKGGEVIHEERVITGLPDKQTPIFSDEIEIVTFHPRWNVPESIKVRELYPSLARGGASFQRQGLKLSQNGRLVDPESVDWSSADIRRYDVHQPPGAGNVLGVLKFSFPNKHQVYMHDTSTRHLFEASSRTFSHGCMRVRNPERLAEILLGADKGWDAEKVRAAIETNPVETPITLDRKIPVHVTYFTVVAGPDGKERALKDVYGHEQRVAQALAGKWSEIVRGPDHLAPVTYADGARPGGGNALEAFLGNIFGGF